MKSSYSCRLLHGDSRNDFSYNFDNSNDQTTTKFDRRYLKHPESQPMTTYESQEIGIGRYTGSYIFGKIQKSVRFPQFNGNILKKSANETKTQQPVNPKFNQNDDDSIYDIYDDTYEEPYALTLKKWSESSIT